MTPRSQHPNLRRIQIGSKSSHPPHLFPATGTRTRRKRNSNTPSGSTASLKALGAKGANAGRALRIISGQTSRTRRQTRPPRRGRRQSEQPARARARYASVRAGSVYATGDSQRAGGGASDERSLTRGVTREESHERNHTRGITRVEPDERGLTRGEAAGTGVGRLRTSNLAFSSSITRVSLVSKVAKRFRIESMLSSVRPLVLPRSSSRASSVSWWSAPSKKRHSAHAPTCWGVDEAGE